MASLKTLSELILEEGQDQAHPSRSNGSMDLGCAVNTENSDLAVLAKLRRCVRLPFDLLVDFGAGVE